MNSRSALLGVALTSALAASLTSAQAQTNAVTDPVGYYTWNVPASSISLLGIGMYRPVEYAGRVTSISGTTVNDTNAAWTVNQFLNTPGSDNQFFIEFTGTNGSSTGGYWFNIADNATATALTVDQSLAGFGITNGTAYKIRRHWTPLSLLPLSMFNPSFDLSVADEVQVYDPQTLNYTQYFYDDGNGYWSDSGGNDSNYVPLYPNIGLVVIRKVASATNGVVVGSVKVAQTKLAVADGINITGNVYPVGAPATNAVTLASSGLYTGNPATGVTPSFDLSVADEVQLLDPVSGNYTQYFYDDGNGYWSDSGGNDANAVEIPIGQAVVIVRKSNGPFSWTAPQPPYAQ